MALITEGDEPTKIQRMGVAGEPSVTAEEPGEGYLFRTGALAVEISVMQEALNLGAT